MPYVGNEPTSNFASVTKDSFSGDGSTTAFTLSKASTTNGVAVFVENVRQEPTTAYAVSGTTLTFTAAPVSSSGNNIYVLHHNAPASTAIHSAAQPLTATSGTFTGAFTSLGIDDNANATSITIDTDEFVGVGTTSPDGTLHVKGISDHGRIVLESGGTSGSNNNMFMQFHNHGGTEIAQIAIEEGASNEGQLIFKTGGTTEAARIDKDGNVGIGTNTPASFETDARNLVVGTGSGSEGMTLYSGNGSYGNIYFADGTSGSEQYQGFVTYNHSNNRLGLGTGGTQKVTVYSEGRMDVLADFTDDYAAHIKNDGNNSNRYGVIISCGTDDASGTNYSLAIYDGDGTAQGYISYSSGTVSYGAFTAHHEISLPNADKSSGYDYGTLVEIDKIYYMQKNGSDTERGIRYLVKKSQGAYSRKVLGAYCGDMLAVADKDILYTEEDTIPDGKKVGDVKTDGGTYKNNLHQAAVLGDGHIICNGEKGNISIGDGICTSSTEGVGMKADKMTMIIGIAQEDVTFSSASETKLVPVQYGVRQFTPWTD